MKRIACRASSKMISFSDSSIRRWMDSSPFIMAKIIGQDTLEAVAREIAMQHILHGLSEESLARPE